jgi:ABC-type molybdate transport system permease subunit
MLRAELAAWWVASATFWVIAALMLRTPEDPVTVAESAVAWLPLKLPPRVTGPRLNPVDTPPCICVDAVEVFEKPFWAS